MYNNAILLLQAISTKSRTHLSLQDIAYIHLFSLSSKVKFGKLRVILSYIISLYTAYVGHIQIKCFASSGIFTQKGQNLLPGGIFRYRPVSTSKGKMPTLSWANRERFRFGKYLQTQFFALKCGFI